MPDQDATAGAPDPLSAEDVRSLYNELRAVSRGRNSEYAAARDLYLGKHWGGVHNPLPDGRRYTITMNYIRPTVSKAVQLLLGQMPAIQVMPPGVEEDARRMAEACEAILYATWDVNEAAKVFRRVAHNRALLRRGLIYYWWDASQKRVGFRSVAPDNFYPIYDGEEIVECVIVSRRLTRSLRRMYPKLASRIVSDDEGDDVVDEGRWTRMVQGNLDILDPGGASGSELRDPMSGQTTVLDWYDKYGNWVRVMGEKASHHQRLGYGTNAVPVIEFPNSLPGDEREPHAEIDDVASLNLYVDQLVSQQADIIRRYANPTIIDKQSGQSAQQIRQTVQGDGGVLPIKRDGDILLLNWAGTAPDIANQHERVMTALYDLSGKPASSYGQLLSNQSGVATNMALSPATMTTEEAQSLFGLGLIQLNEAILRLTEKFMRGQPIEIRQGAARGRAGSGWRFYDVQITGDQIGGWYKNRIKWPSALRTDDPIYVQNELAKAKGDGSSPPAQSLYTTLENLGVEDVEAEIDRIKQQLEDPRLHPDRLQAAVSAAQAFQESQLPAGMEGLDPVQAGGGAPVDPLTAGAALEASGSPHGSKSKQGSGSGGGY